MKILKKYYNLMIIGICLILYVIFRISFGSNLLLYIVTPLLGVGAHVGVTRYFDYEQEKLESSYEFQSRNLSERNETELSQIVEKLYDMRHNSEFNGVITQFLDKLDSFHQKEEALNELIQMNDDKSKRFLQERSQATTSFVIASAKKLIKALIAYGAMSKRNRPESAEKVTAVKDVLASMDSLAHNYDQLLEEVSKMGDDFNPEDPGLRDVVENLQEIRASSAVDDDDDDDDDIHLFVTKT